MKKIYEWTPRLEGVKPYIRTYIDNQGTEWEIWIYDKGFFELAFDEEHSQIVLAQIYVHERYRKRGYATKLFEKALLYATILRKPLAVIPAEKQFWHRMMSDYPNMPARDGLRIAFFLQNPKVIEEKFGYAKIEVS